MKQVVEATTVHVTENELRAILIVLEGTPFCHLYSRTIERNMNKTNNPYYNSIVKETRSNVLLGTDYSIRIENNAKKEGNDIDFIPQQNNVGNRIGGVLRYNEKTQNTLMDYEFFGNQKPSVNYFFNGEPIEYNTFKEYLRPKAESPKTQDVIEKKVFWRSISLKNIIEITIDKTKYIVAH